MLAGLLIIIIALGGCSSPENEAPSSRQVVTEIPSELVFELPPDWVESSTVNARIFGGPRGTPEENVTVTLQTLSKHWLKAPDLALHAALQAHPHLSPTLLAQTPVILTTESVPKPGLLYSMAFTHHREPFRRVGLILAHQEQLLDLHYTANTDLFASSFPVFEGLLESLGTRP